MIDTLDIDKKSRLKIVSELDKNFFVIANAGSGKTTILVNRMVALVEAGKDISKICAITFTKNAAVEFLDRFQEALRERMNAKDDTPIVNEGDLGPSNDTKRNNCKNALKNINKCFLGTIDSFCNQILSEYPIYAKIPSSSNILDEKDELNFYLEEYKKISLEKDSSIYESFKAFNTLNKNGQESFSNTISDVIRAQTLNIVFDEPKMKLEDKFKEFKNKYEKDIKNDLLEIYNCEKYVIPDRIDKFNEFKKAFNRLNVKWQIYNISGIINDILRLLEDIRFIEEPQTKYISYTYMSRNKVYKIEKKNIQLNDISNEFNEIKYSYSIDFLVKVAKRVRQRLKDEGKLTFDEYLLTFREMLIEDMNSGMNIIKHIYNKHSYFLIDESQDTSPFQTELFLYLTSKNKALKIEDCNPMPGSLFILGDPKQSIYRFRGADVPSYLKTRDLFKNVFDQNENEVLLMTQNFRSHIDMIKYFNKVFEKMDNYEQIPVLKGIGGTFGLYKYDNYINVIKKMLNNPNYKVKVKDKNRIKDEDGLSLPIFKDFMIITTNKEKHDEIINELRLNNIPCYTEGSFSISDNAAIKSVYAIFNYIVNKYDISKGALKDLLTSPIFNFKYDEIVDINLSNLDEKTKKYLDIIDSLSDIKNPIVLYEKLLNHIELFKRIDFINMEYAYFILEALKDAYNNAVISNNLDALLFIEDIINKKQERIMSMDYKPNAVMLANLHKVKGLEAPIVILIKAGVNNNKKATIRMDYVNSNSYIMNTDSNKFNGITFYNIKTSKFENEESLEVLEAKNEEDRLRYVAATRARSYLFINDYGKSYWKNLITDDFLDFDESNIDDIIPDSYEIDYAFDNKNNNEFNNQNSYNIKSPSKLLHDRVNNKFSEIDENKDLKIDSRLKGTIIHRMLELIVVSKFMNKKEDIINFIINEFNLNDDINYHKLLNDVYDTMYNGGYIQKNGIFNDLFSILKKSNCYCEIPFSYKNGNDIWYGNIDLLFNYDNNWYIIDYKTNYEDENLDIEYKNQLKAYKEALKVLKNIDAKTYIYHIG